MKEQNFNGNAVLALYGITNKNLYIPRLNLLFSLKLNTSDWFLNNAVIKRTHTACTQTGRFFNPLSASIFDEICYFWTSASVDIRSLPGAWVAELLGVVLGVQDQKKIKFLMAIIVAIGS